MCCGVKVRIRRVKECEGMKEEVGEMDCSVELKGRLGEVCDGGGW